jgi:hypothetical protein
LQTPDTSESKQEEGELRDSGEDTKSTENQVLEQTSETVSIRNFEKEDVFSVTEMKINILYR